MTRTATSQLNRLFRPLAAAVLLAAFAAPAYVAAADSGAAMSSTETTHDERVDMRIKDLHSKLKIAADQESKWKDVTDVMHENADKMLPLIEARKANESTRNAVDDLKSYAEVAATHADGVKKFAAAFEPLYDSMSDAQKKTADAMFRKHGHEEHHHSKTAAAKPAAQ